MKMLVQVGLGGRVPAQPEKRFLVSQCGWEQCVRVSIGQNLPKTLSNSVMTRTFSKCKVSQPLRWHIHILASLAALRLSAVCQGQMLADRVRVESVSAASNTIAAGAVESGPHQTEVIIRLSRPVSAPVAVWLDGGCGFGKGTAEGAGLTLPMGGPAKIVCGKQEYVAGDNKAIVVQTDEKGLARLRLTSSNLLGEKCVVRARGGDNSTQGRADAESQAVTFERGETVLKVGEGAFLVRNSIDRATDRVTVTRSYDGKPLQGHDTIFYVKSVSLGTTNLTFDFRDPTRLVPYASILPDESRSLTDSNGQAVATLRVRGAWSVSVATRDLQEFNSPRSLLDRILDMFSVSQCRVVNGLTLYRDNESDIIARIKRIRGEVQNVNLLPCEKALLHCGVACQFMMADQGGMAEMAARRAVQVHDSFASRFVLGVALRMDGRPRVAETEFAKAAEFVVGNPLLLRDAQRQMQECSVVVVATNGAAVCRKKNAQMERLIRDIGHERFGVRQQAKVGIRAMGMAAVPYLREEIHSADPEVKMTARQLLDELGALPYLIADGMAE